MKKAGLPAILFLVSFVLTYLVCCYLIPAFKIKLAADPWTYFLTSIQHMAVLKTVLSLVAGLTVGGISAAISKTTK